MAEKNELLDGVSPETDELASTLMGDALDLLAAATRSASFSPCRTPPAR